VAKRPALYPAIAALFFLLVYAALKSSPAEIRAAKERLAIERSKPIHDALYRWYFASDNNDTGYPATLDQMLAAGMIQLPINPFTNEPMQAVRFDAPSPGNFSYMPRKMVWRYKDGRIVSKYEDFILLVYGETGRFSESDGNRGVLPYLLQSLPVIESYVAPRPNRGNLSEDMISRQYESWTYVFKRAGYAELSEALEPLDAELQRGWTEP
jgi:hypothetical protein